METGTGAEEINLHVHYSMERREMELNWQDIYSDFCDALTDSAVLNSIRRMVENGEICSNAIRSALGLPTKNPFGESEERS